MLGIVTYRIFKWAINKIIVGDRKTIFTSYLAEMIVCTIIIMIILIEPAIGARWKLVSYYWLPMVLIISIMSISEVKGGGGILSKKYLTKLGSASYEMYMIHAIMISFFQHGFDKFSEGRIGFQILFMLICLACTVVAGLYFHKLNNKVIKWIIR